MDLFSLDAVINLSAGGFMSGLDIAGKAFGGFKRLVETGVDMVLDFGKDAIRTGLEFDEVMSGVFAVTQSTDKGVQSMLENAAIAEAQISAFTSAEVAMAEYYEGLAGYNPKEIAEGLKGIVVAAEASGESLPLVADIVTDVTRAFKGSASDQEHVADVLAATATSTNTTIGKMGQSFKNVAPQAGAVGYAIEDVAISFGIMADHGTKASQAGTSLRNIMTRIATNAGATETKLGALDIITDKLGVDFYDSAGKVRPWITVVDEAREAWKGLDEAGRSSVLDSFAQIAVGGKNADEVLENLTADIKRVETLNNLLNSTQKETERNTYGDEIRTIVSSYSELFNLLGIEADPATLEINKVVNSLDQARIKLGLMTDQEKIYFSNQIGNLRGMTGWLELMEAEEDHYNAVRDAVINSAGAAEAMRNIRMGSNLAGDVKSFSAALDGLETRMYLSVRDPMREVVQEGTDGLLRISAAIGEDGIIGGLKQLTVELRDIKENESFKEFVSSAGEAAGEIISIATTEVGPALSDTAINLGSKFATGLIQGAAESLKGTTVGDILFDTKDYGIMTAIGNAIFGGSDKSVDRSVPVEKRYTIQLDADVQPMEQAIDGVTENVDPIRILPDPASLGFTKTEVERIFAEAGTDGGQQMFNNVKDRFNQTTTDLQGALIETLVSAGRYGGSLFSTLFSNEINYAAPGMRNDLSDTLGSAGRTAGSSIASGIQSALNIAKFTVGVTGVINTVTNLFKTKKNAAAMSSGRIFTRPTVFDYADGAFQVAGDAGPEAVVGVNSLQRMIASAVRSAGAGQEIVVPRNQGRDITIILELDRQQFARAVYKSNNEETQRVGVRLATGGVI